MARPRSELPHGSIAFILAAVEELDVRRLMTNDTGQAEAARAMGFEVVTPGL